VGIAQPVSSNLRCKVSYFGGWFHVLTSHFQTRFGLFHLQLLHIGVRKECTGVFAGSRRFRYVIVVGYWDVGDRWNSGYYQILRRFGEYNAFSGDINERQ
jgi:hypothetical protein